MNLNELAIITPIVNSPRYKTRIENFGRFRWQFKRLSVKLHTVEIAFGDRPFEATEVVKNDSDPYLQLRSVEELWHKENMINVAIAHIVQKDPAIKYIAWVDADCFPISITPLQWLEETWQQLQHYQFVQMWEYLINFGPDNQPISGPQMSFMKTYAANGFTIPQGKNVKHTLAGNSGMVSLGRPGLAWAASVDALNKVGGLIDFCILGSGDWHMAHGLVGGMNQGSAEHKEMSAYSKKLLQWQELAERHIRRDVGYVPITLGHWFHGDKVDRQYGSRGQILIDNKYDPETDIKYDGQGLIQLESWEPRQLVLRDKIRDYFRSRNEDSVALR